MPKAKRRNPLAIVLWSLVLLIVTVSLIAWTRTGSGSIQADVAAIHKLGYPTTQAEITSLEPHSGADAGPLLFAFENRRATRAESEATAILEDPGYFKPTATALEHAANEIRPTIKPLIEASRMGFWTAVTRPSTGDGRIPKELLRPDEDLATFNRYARLLTGMARADSESGNLDEAVTDSQAAEGLSRLAGQKAFLISYFTSNFMEGHVLSGLTRLLQKRGDDPQTLRSVSQFLASLPPLPNLKNAFEGDFVFTLNLANLEGMSDPSASLMTRLKDIFYEAPRARHAMAQEIHGFRLAFEAMPRDPSDLDGMRAAFQRAGEQTKPDWITKAYNADMSLSGSANNDSVMDLNAQVCDVQMQQVARRRMVQDECRVLQYRLDHGSLPSSLPDYGSDSIDPFSHSSFVYRPKGKGFILYSIGRNRRDDGGIRSKRSTLEGDIVDRF